MSIKIRIISVTCPEPVEGIRCETQRFYLTKVWFSYKIREMLIFKINLNSNARFSAISAASAVKYLGIISEIRDNSWKFVVKTKRYLKKQTQFYAFFGPKTAILPKTKPKQSQIEKQPKWTYTLYWQSVMKKYDDSTEMKTNPKFIAAKRSEDGQTQFLSAALFGGFGNTGRKKADLSRRSSEGTKTDEEKQEI